MIRGGFQDNRSAITLTEGETLNVCVERKGFDPNNLERQFSLKIEAPQSKLTLYVNTTNSNPS